MLINSWHKFKLEVH